MIKVTELRIGNWVQTQVLKSPSVPVFPRPNAPSSSSICLPDVQTVYHQIEALWENMIQLQGWDTYKINLNDWRGIPLTPQILEKCGFKRIDDGKDDDFEEMYETERGDRIDNEKGTYKWWHNDRYYSYVELKTVHQLQNLYFALTGQELTVNL